MKCCLTSLSAVLVFGGSHSLGQIIPAPVVYPNLFGPADAVTVTPPPRPSGALVSIALGGTATGDLGEHWTGTATGGATVGSILGTIAQTGATVKLNGSELVFGLDSPANSSLLGALGVGTGLALGWSADLKLDAPGQTVVLKPNTTYRIKFDVDGSGGLLNSLLSIAPVFRVQMLDGQNTVVNTATGASLINLIGLPLAPIVGSPVGSGTATVEFRTGASVGAGAGSLRFSGSAVLPASLGNIGTEFATISSLTFAEITPYVEWAEDNDLEGGDMDPDADPDGDGRTNVEEFAVASDPNAGDGQNVYVAVGDADGQGPETSVLVMTLPVRSGAVFNSGTNGSRVASQDGVSYKVEGSFELANWVLAVSEVTPNSGFTSSLPDIPEGWSYRSFRVPGETKDTRRAFLRVVLD